MHGCGFLFCFVFDKFISTRNLYNFLLKEMIEYLIFVVLWILTGFQRKI